MLRTVAVVALVAAMALALTGCGGAEDCTKERALATAGVPATASCITLEDGNTWCHWPAPDGCIDSAFFFGVDEWCGEASRLHQCLPPP